jgi:hypothetical protein
MDLSQYLKGAEECPEEMILLDGHSISRANMEFGIYNNYRILLKDDAEKMKDFLTKSEQFNFLRTIPSSRKTHCFNYVPGIVSLQLFNVVWHEFEKGYEQMQRDYIATITLHPAQKKDMPDIRSVEAQDFNSKKSNIAIIRVIRDLTNLLKDNKISFCLPESSKDYSTMIKYSP